MRIWLTGVIWLLGLMAYQPIWADEYETLFHQANQYYDNGDYAAAAETYEKIVQAGRGNWQLFYNLGNAYFRLNEIGRAILYYEKALRLNPDNEDIRFNLDYANLKIVDRIPEPPKQAFVLWVERLVLGPPFRTLLWMTLGLYALTLVLLALRYFYVKLEASRGYRLLLWTSSITFVIFLALFGLRWYKLSTEKYGIVMAKAVTVTSSPTRDATEVFELHEGTKLRIEEQSGDWLRIRLRDGKVGWIPRNAVETI